MTQRTEARFKVYSTANTTIKFTPMSYNIIDFNVGGNYDTSTYTYTIENAGVYLMGHSHTKKASGNPGTNPFEGRVFLQLTRDGTTYNLSRAQIRVFNAANTTISCYLMYKFEVGDTLQVMGSQGQPMMNIGFVGGNHILNSWWGIKLDY